MLRSSASVRTYDFDALEREAQDLEEVELEDVIVAFKKYLLPKRSAATRKFRVFNLQPSNDIELCVETGSLLLIVSDSTCVAYCSPARRALALMVSSQDEPVDATPITAASSYTMDELDVLRAEHAFLAVPYNPLRNDLRA
eukprot:TRINITY_DN7356_c0_g1_i1.p2 TRINITY_DN7356_c0_g1~~TRINITY_DN7356_c0_g1_i1.p2  ORF type:complete len:141 (-),score=31.54 TRINITY_DN7356_c0_g1_i1:1588-2010(-)